MPHSGQLSNSFSVGSQTQTEHLLAVRRDTIVICWFGSIRTICLPRPLCVTFSH